MALLAHRSVLRHPERTLANVSSLVLALALATLITTVGLSFRKTLLDWFSVVLQSDVMVSSYNRMPHYIVFAQPLHVAYVVDPINQSRGFFQWRDGGGLVNDCQFCRSTGLVDRHLHGKPAWGRYKRFAR